MLQQETSAGVSSTAPMSAASAVERYLPAIALSCALLALWMFQHPGVGYDHDSRFYLIQALAQFDPALFSQDIFLRYGSQDRFTVFSPLFAGAMRLFGIEGAAPVLTLIAQACFFAATAVLARLLMPVRLAWLSVGLLCALQAFYGPGQIFELVEDFATPRLFAETCVVAAFAAFLAQRLWLAAAFTLLGMVLHPLMTMGGIVVALCMNVTPPRVRVLAIVAGLVGAVGLLVFMNMQGNQLRFDHEWVRLLRSGLPYLWPSNWNLVTWGPLFVSSATLVIGLLILERSHARSLCGASLIAAVAAVLLTYVFGDLLQIALVVQGQPYRWLWVSKLVSIVLLPLILHRMWARELFGRVAALLLVAAWICMTASYGAGIAALALLAAVAASRSSTLLPHRTQKLFLLGASAALALAVAIHIADMSLYVEGLEGFSTAPRSVYYARTIMRSGVFPFTAFLLIYFAVSQYRSRAARLGVTAVCLAIVGALLPISAQEWTARWYAHDYDAYSEWRALIPPGAEVLWFDAPVSTWMVLHRPSYLSNLQMTSGVFSRPAAMAMKHRVDSLESYLSTDPAAAWREKRIEDLETEQDVKARADNPVPLAALCAAAPDLRFIVTSKNMLAEPLAAAPRNASARYRSYRLFRCDPPSAEAKQAS